MALSARDYIEALEQLSRRAWQLPCCLLSRGNAVFGEGPIGTLPAHQRMTTGFTAALAVHAVLLVIALIVFRPHPVRVASGGTTQVGIAAFDPGAVGTSGTAPRQTPKVAVARKAPAPRDAKPARSTDPEPTDAGAGGGAAGAQGAGSGSGPVRLGSGEGLTLLNKVTPVYPRIMETARVPGVVVLDAIIHRDGTIGDVTIVKSSGEPFSQAAMAAVKQWRYTPLPYEGLVTVTVNFTLPH
jgi:TonB family protein